MRGDAKPPKKIEPIKQEKQTSTKKCNLKSQSNTLDAREDILLQIYASGCVFGHLTATLSPWSMYTREKGKDSLHMTVPKKHSEILLGPGPYMQGWSAAVPCNNRVYPVVLRPS